MTDDGRTPPSPLASQPGAATTTLDPAAGQLVIINTYTVKPERADELLDLLVRANVEVMQDVPGFISSNLHLSLDRRQLVNYAQWASVEATVAARDNPEVQARIQAVAEVADGFTPVLYALRGCFPAHRG